MNPFLLGGPEFLLFYAVLGALALFLLRRRIMQDASVGRRDLQALASDPYRVAYLRGGAREALKIVTISLVDRGLLKVDKRNVQIRDLDALKIAQRPIEREVLRHYYSRQTIHHMPTEKLRAACDEYHADLLQQGLLATQEERRQRWLMVTVVASILLATTLIKLDIALAQGKHNIIFLIVMTAAFCGYALLLGARQRSARGDELLNDLKSFFHRLKDRADSVDPGGASNEAILLAAVFGAQFLPHAKFPFINQLYPTSNSCGSGGDGGGGGGCGSGCGGCGS